MLALLIWKQTYNEVMQISIETSDGKRIIEEITDEHIIGRGSQADFVVTTHDISRAHAKIAVKEGKIIIVDLGSPNGTRINGEALQPNQEYELVTYFPATLGGSVLITLLND